MKYVLLTRHDLDLDPKLTQRLADARGGWQANRLSAGCRREDRSDLVFLGLRCARSKARRVRRSAPGDRHGEERPHCRARLGPASVAGPSGAWGSPSRARLIELPKQLADRTLRYSPIYSLRTTTASG